ncbi:thioredoxin family protein [Marinobacter nauticus]|nr:thioredoxin family protein [Alteromonadaceae bacterium]
MQSICSEEALSELLQSSPAVLLLYGGASCGVCQAIKPQLEKLVSEEFPRLVTAYIDCQATAGPLCAARGIFSLPVVQLWFEGQRFAEFVRVFSLGEVRAALERPYGLLS